MSKRSVRRICPTADNDALAQRLNNENNSINDTSSSDTMEQEEISQEFTLVNRKKGSARRRSTQKTSAGPSANPPAASATPLAGRKVNPTSESNFKPPPIVVKTIPVAELRPELQSRGFTPQFRLSGIGTSIVTRSRSEYDGVVKYLQERKAEFFSHDAKQDRPFKAVLRGLPEMDIPEIVEELQGRYQLEVLEAFEIKRRIDTIHSRLYLVHFKRGTCSLKKLEAVRTIQQVIIRWEAYRGGKKGPTQCHRCQDFGHGTRHCNIQPRCARCAGQHITEACPTKDQNEALKCSNCSGPHGADDPTCPRRAKYVEVRQQASRRQAKHQDLPNPVHRQIPPRPLITAPPMVRPPPATSTHTATQPSSSVMQTNRTASIEPNTPPGFITLAQRLENARNAPDTPTPVSEANLFSMQELFSIFTKMMSKLRLCRNKAEQLAVIGELLMLNG